MELFQILEAFNTALDTIHNTKSVISIFTGRTRSETSEIQKNLRECSLRGYENYCLYRDFFPEDLGIPEKEAVLDYWESCVKRDCIPGIGDMVEQCIADKEEAKVLLPFLMREWMSNIDFSIWFHELLTSTNLEHQAENIKELKEQLVSMKRILQDHGICDVAKVIDYDCVLQARKNCTDLDVQMYSRVDNNFERMLRVISANRDIPHQKACEEAWCMCVSKVPTIIAGDGGVGKTSVMLRVAVQWACSGNIALWLTLGHQDGITTAAIRKFFSQLLCTVPKGRKLLLCIDNPRDNQRSMEIIRQEWPGNERIQLLLAERCKDLLGLADETYDCLAGLFDGGKVVLLGESRKKDQQFSLKTYETKVFAETCERKRQILELCASFYVSTEDVFSSTKNRIIDSLLSEEKNADASLVELIYRMIFLLNERASNPAGMRLDWHEWESLLNSLIGGKKSDLSFYGVIAACSIINMPVTLDLFCRFFGIDKESLRLGLKRCGAARNKEPIRYNSEYELLQPKHDMVAELFFQFNKDKIEVRDLLPRLIQIMELDEIELLLEKAVDKSRMRSQRGCAELRFAYWLCLEEIKRRCEEDNLCLSAQGCIRLCFGFLWAASPLSVGEVEMHLRKLMPSVSPDAEIRKLYTDWGRWAVKNDKPKLAEELFLSVINQEPREVYARMELGRLLSYQRRRKMEAVFHLREATHVAPRDVYLRVELGRILSRQRGYEEEAESHFRVAIDIEPNNPYPRTELGFMLSRQKGRELEAEAILLQLVREWPDDISSRDILAKLYIKQKNFGKAKRLYLEICQLNAEDVLGKKGLSALVNYKDEDYDTPQFETSTV